MSRVDLQDPETLVEARRELSEAVREAERIATQARIGYTQLLDEATRRVRELASMDPPPVELLNAAIGLEAEIRGSGSELLETIVRVSTDIRFDGTTGAGLLAKYHDRLTGARSNYTSRSVTSPSGNSPGTRQAGAPSGQNRDAAIEAAREAVQSAAEQGGQATPELTPEEIDAIRRYTSHESLEDWQGHWYEIGSALLRGARRDGRRLTLEDLERFEHTGSATSGIAAAIRGLRKLPPVAGELHRGVGKEGWTSDARASYLKQFVPGSRYRDPGFLSGSWRPTVAEHFAGDHGVLLHIAAKTARSVEGLSQHLEREAVILPLTDFRVLRVQAPSVGPSHVWLKEIG